MTHYTSRRNWLKSTALLASGMALGPLLPSVSGRNHFYGRKMVDYTLPLLPVINQMPLKARLLANENPYGPCDAARLAIMESVGRGNRYGHTDAHTLMEMIAKKEGVKKENIMLGPGSTDMLEKTAIISFLHGGNVVSAHPAYMSLINTSKAIGADWKSVPLTKDHAHDLPGMEAAIDSDTKLVYVCNPNNPTGSITPADSLKAFCKRVSKKVPVFVDEAYLEFYNPDYSDSMVSLVNEGKDVIVARTFSKIYGMAGLRIGYIVGTEERIEKMQKMVRGTMGLCITSIKGAMASLESDDFVAACRKKNTAAREYVCGELDKKGFAYIPSNTSFVIFPIDMPTKTMQEKMLSHGVGIRVYDIDDQAWLRVSMGTLEEMEIFTKTLNKVLS